MTSPRAKAADVPRGKTTKGKTVLDQVAAAARTAAREKPAAAFVVVDSIQAVYDPETEGAPGSAGWRLVQLARELNTAMLLLAHVDKSSGLARPMVLQHDVDAVVMLEGAPDEPLRILRARKNRFGPTIDAGRCEMTARGLQ